MTSSVENFAEPEIVPSKIQNYDPLVPTLFHEKWWLDIFAEEKYAHVEVVKSGKTVGRLIYFVGCKKYGMSVSKLPRLVHFLGPAVDEGHGDIEKRARERHEITCQLIQQLPKFGLISYKCHREVTNVIAFQENGFQTRAQFTLEVRPRPLDDIWQGMTKKKRSQIRRAQKILHMSKMEKPNEFVNFYDSNLREKKVKNIYHFGKLEQAITYSLEHHRGAVFAARDETGVLNAAIFFAWDQTSAYYLMTTRSGNAHDGAISMLIWEAIQHACSRGLIFDFDGLYNNGSFDFFAGFGATVQPRYIVSRYSRLARLPSGLKSMFISDHPFF